MGSLHVGCGFSSVASRVNVQIKNKKAYQGHRQFHFERRAKEAVMDAVGRIGNREGLKIVDFKCCEVIRM